MDRHSVNWRGYIPAITTPFSQDGALDVDATKRLHHWVYQNGVHGMIVLGTQGEWFSLSKAEKQTLLQITGEQLSGKLPLIAGCNAFTAGEAIDNIESAAANGFDGVLITPPPYVVPTDEEILAFYQDISAVSALPICVYNWPPGTNVDMSLSLLSSLAKLDKVVAIKNSTPDKEHFLNVLLALKDEVRIFGVPMNERGIALVRDHNADGTMGAGAILGRDQPDFFNAIWAGDYERAKLLGKRDEIIMGDLFKPDYTGRFGSAQATFKEALNQQGLPGGYTRRPILPLTPQGAQKVRETLAKLGKIAEQ